MSKRVLLFTAVLLLSAFLIVSCAGNNTSESITSEQDNESVTDSQVSTTQAGTAEETDSQSETGENETTDTHEDTTEPNVTEVITGEPIEIQVFEITITYVFNDGTKAAPSHKAQYEAGTALYIESPEIEGYEPNLEYISWSSINKEKTFRVVYTPIGETDTTT